MYALVIIMFLDNGTLSYKRCQLQVHGEVTSPEVDVFDREKVFIETVLGPLVQRLPQLKIVMEHVTTLDAVKFVESCREGILSLDLPFFIETVLAPHLYLIKSICL